MSYSYTFGSLRYVKNKGLISEDIFTSWNYFFKPLIPSMLLKRITSKKIGKIFITALWFSMGVPKIFPS